MSLVPFLIMLTLITGLRECLLGFSTVKLPYFLSWKIIEQKNKEFKVAIGKN